MNTVVVTGFGPFGEHKINASWEGVKLLPKITFHHIKVITKEIPVTYQHVVQIVPDLWREYNPKLVIHVGVSSYADKITIESQAFRKGYIKTDCENNIHPTGECCIDGEDCIKCAINVQQICDHINSNTKLKACVSTNAGRYLCEFIYYQSLKINKDKTLFIHVPPLGQPYTAEELAHGLAEIIKYTLSQTSEDTCSCASK